MDKILEIETILIQNKIEFRNVSMSMVDTENKMLKEVEREAKVTKDSMLSNAELRKIAVRERLLMDDEYCENLTRKLELDDKIQFGEAILAEKKREFIMMYCQNKLPI